MRDHPKYHLLLAQVEANEGDYRKARKTLERGLGLVEQIESKDGGESGLRDGEGSEPFDFNLSDKYMLYMELIRALRLLEETKEADKRMEEAFSVFKVKALMENTVQVAVLSTRLDEYHPPCSRARTWKVDLACSLPTTYWQREM